MNPVLLAAIGTTVFSGGLVANAFKTNYGINSNNNNEEDDSNDGAVAINPANAHHHHFFPIFVFIGLRKQNFNF